MNLHEHLLTVLAEEGSEITKEACKALRFGPDDRLDPDSPTVSERLINELNDLMAVAEMLALEGVIPMRWMNRKKISAKITKVRECMTYAHNAGTLEKGGRAHGRR